MPVLLTCRRCMKPMVQTAGVFGKSSSDGKGDQQEQVVELVLEEGFRYLGELDTFHTDSQFQMAVENMGFNAMLLRQSVGKYLKRWEKMQVVPHLTKFFEIAAPLVKVVVENGVPIAGAAVAKVAQQAADKFMYTDVQQLSSDVVERSCADVLMTLNAMMQSSDLREAHKSFLVSNFLLLHNSLQVQAYDTNISKESVRMYVSRKLRKPLLSLAGHYAQVLDIIGVAEQAEKLDVLLLDAHKPTRARKATADH